MVCYVVDCATGGAYERMMIEIHQSDRRRAKDSVVENSIGSSVEQERELRTLCRSFINRDWRFFVLGSYSLFSLQEYWWINVTFNGALFLDGLLLSRGGK